VESNQGPQYLTIVTLYHPRFQPDMQVLSLYLAPYLVRMREWGYI